MHSLERSVTKYNRNGSIKWKNGPKKVEKLRSVKNPKWHIIALGVMVVLGLALQYLIFY